MDSVVVHKHKVFVQIVTYEIDNGRNNWFELYIIFCGMRVIWVRGLNITTPPKHYNILIGNNFPGKIKLLLTTWFSSDPLPNVVIHKSISGIICALIFTTAQDKCTH